MHKMTRACQISTKVKQKVRERDNDVCVLCGSPYGEPNAHYIARSHGGLGVEENTLTLCYKCHTAYDNSANRRCIKEILKNHLRKHYPDWDEERLVYRKYAE